ncbi:LacI family DNA-binding transcriptional regulator [Lacticaseibacillus absianus]|uniref:LacI family DNA-binding transcriptional regulator n=1 Tax=Lacticaseibacillus absianus TaxID=2729623 RepID=UPI0015CA7F79|nr:LacI family DNA-binding transcriptional regulator [Lacticaseibacillus absianus]
MVNIQDVARRARTSKSTVSRVISGNPHVAAATRARILAAIDALQYVPNGLARQMQAQRSHTLGLLTRGYFPVTGDYMNAFAKVAASYGYRVTVFFTTDKASELAVLDQLRTHLLDGVCLMSKFNAWAKIRPYAEYGPIATWRRVESRQIYSSFVDHEPVYRQILDYLHAQGDTRIGHVFNARESSNTQARLRAIAVDAAAHPGTDHRWQRFYSAQEGSGAAAAVQWLADPAAPPVVVIYSDYVAADFIAELRTHGRQVPGDCRVFGFDNSAFGRVMQLTTVEPFLAQQAHNAFAYLYTQLTATPLPVQVIQPQLVFRETC